MKKINLYLFGVLLLMSCQKGGDLFKSYGEVVSEKRQVSYFNRITVGDKFDVTLIQDSSKDGQIIMYAGKNVIKGYTSKVQNQELMISNDNKYNWVRNLKVRQKVEIYFKDLDKLTINASAKIVNIDTIYNQSTIEIIQGGLEDAELNIVGDYIYVNSSNTGGVKINGSCFLFSASVDDISFVDASELYPKKCFISSFSRDHSFVRGIEELNIRVFGEGHIYYHDTLNLKKEIIFTGNSKAIKIN
jgi:hypothetical protein